MKCFLIVLVVLVTYAVADTTTEMLETTTLSDDLNSTAPGNYSNITNTEKGVKVRSPSVCTCNLYIDWCDLNCCCDPDCTPSDKQIFDHCHVEEDRFVDDRYCNYVQHIYVNNTPFDWVVNREGFFCVISSNLPPSHVVQKDKALTPSEMLDTAPIWGSPPSSRSRILTGYTYGTPLLIVSSNSTLLEFLRLPTGLQSSACLIKQEVKFLKDTEWQCSQFDLSDSNDYLSFSTFYENITVVGNPSLFNSSRLECPKNVCLEVEPQLCTDQTWSDCQQLTSTKQFKYSYCQNALKSLLYRFHHNGTQGLVRVQVLGVLSNFTPTFTHFKQDFSVEFLWINRSKSEILSGNPGYLIGRPVLLATKVSKNNLTVIEPFFGGEFGYNVKTKQPLKVTVPLKRNVTCRDIQTAILDMWHVTWRENHTALFGMFGNSSTDTDWGEVSYKTLPATLLNVTRDTLAAKSLICNLATLLDVQMFYSRVHLGNVLRNQNKLLGVVYTFAEPFNRTLSRTNESVEVSLEVVVRVSFHDVTAPRRRKFADPPTFDVTLPYDFFYPFVKMGNCAPSQSYSVVILVAISSVCFA